MRSAALTLALLILLSGAAPAIAMVPSGVDGGQELSPATALDSTPVAPQVDGELATTEIQIRLQPNTDARWTIVHRYPLSTETEVDAFRSLGAEFEAGRADVGFTAQVFRSVADIAAESTGREMRILDVEREATVEERQTTATTTPTQTETSTIDGSNVRQMGVLRLSFTWTNFLEEDDDGTLRLGDVFTTPEEGTWLSSLGEDQRLTVVTPEGYVISRTSFPVQTQNGSLVIDGPREFTSDERLSVTYQRTGAAELPLPVLVGGGVAVVVVLVLMGLLVRSRRADSSSGGDPAMANGGEYDTAAGESTDTVAGTGAGAAAMGENPDDDTDAEEEAETDVELLSDEERVERLLRERGGRMKQANIVKETGWSDAKVSQLLSAMASAGRVEKLRLGRENLISLPGEAEDED